VSDVVVDTDVASAILKGQLPDTLARRLAGQRLAVLTVVYRPDAIADRCCIVSLGHTLRRNANRVGDVPRHLHVQRHERRTSRPPRSTRLAIVSIRAPMRVRREMSYANRNGAREMRSTWSG
jgi:hypothetical protein